jgi:hypothetical protein
MRLASAPFLFGLSAMIKNFIKSFKWHAMHKPGVMAPDSRDIICILRPVATKAVV